MPGTFYYYLILAPVLILAITCHEFAHAAMARLWGDRTAQDEGRLTLNPLAHLDPVGTLLIFVVGFGWGKPVPVNLSRLRYRWADALVSLAGPATNLTLAYLASRLLLSLQHQPQSTSSAVLMLGAFLAVQLNLGLCFFNLIPVFPLDGSHVLPHLLPGALGERVNDWNHRYGSIVLLILIVTARVTGFDPLAMLLEPPIGFFLRRWLGGAVPDA